jgi:vacuolar-type H+-ATPase subunit C/Vma6
MEDVLKPTPQLLIKLGSIITHYEELNSPHGHHLDRAAIDALMENDDVKEWFDGMNKMAFLPVKRN